MSALYLPSELVPESDAGAAATATATATAAATATATATATGLSGRSTGTRYHGSMGKMAVASSSTLPKMVRSTLRSDEWAGGHHVANQ
jgi:hypothetical protein